MTAIAVVSAGLSEPSSTRLLADRLAAAAVTALGGSAEDQGDVRVVTIELRPLAHEITDAMLTRFTAPALGAAIAELVEADAVIAVTPIFTSGVSGLFKSFVDVLDNDALVDMPVLLGATGGTARHSLAVDHAMRPLFAYLRAAVAPTAVFAATDDWGTAEGTAALDGRIRRAGADLAHLLRTSRRVAPVSEADAGVVDFGSLLQGLGQ